MKRHIFQHDGLTLSWLDAGGDGEILVALHAHCMEALTFARLAADLAPEWRVIALDQRGHGHSSHAVSYSREDYIGDLEAFCAKLDLTSPIVLLGNSLGGINALQFAARYPQRVRALVLEDIAVEVRTDIGFVRAWSGTFPTRDVLAERMGTRMLPYLENSFRFTPEGWQLAFDPEDMVQSQESLKGQYSDEWLVSQCPALVIRGRESVVTTQAEMEEMVRRRPNARLLILDGGRVVHQDSPALFSEQLRRFLQTH